MPTRSPRRLSLEALEPRWTPAVGPQGSVVTWINPSDGDWNVGENWSTGSVPGPQDDVVIPAGVVVSYKSGEGSVNSISCDGTLDIESGFLDVSQASTVANLTLAGGYFSADAGLTVNGNFDWTAGNLAGTTIDLFGTSTLSGRGGDQSMVLLDASVENHGTLTWSGGNILNEGGQIDNLFGAEFDVSAVVGTDLPFTNAGRFLISLPDAAVSFGSFTQTGGLTVIQGGILSIEEADLEGGTLTGWGTVKGTLDNSGTVAPDGGELVIGQDYNQTSDGALSLIVGTEADSTLTVGGTATLDGEFDASLPPGAEPADGTVYVALSAAAVDGQFATVVTQPSDAGATLSAQYSDTAVSLLVTAAPAPPPRDPPPDLPPAKSPPVTPTSSPTPPAAPADPAPAAPTTPTVTATVTPPQKAPTQDDRTDIRPTVVPLTIGPAGLTPVRADIQTTQPGQAGGLAPVGDNRGRQGPVTPTAGGPGAGALVPPAAPPALPAPPALVGRVRSDMAGAWSEHVDEELANDLFAVMPVELPPAELPSPGELLSTTDIAGALVVGVRARANLVPQRGAHLAGVATLVATEDERGPDAEVSPLAGLYLSPLGVRGALPAPGQGEKAAGEGAKADEAAKPGGVMREVALGVLAVGVAWSVGSARRSKRRPALP